MPEHSKEVSISKIKKITKSSKIRKYGIVYEEYTKNIEDAETVKNEDKHKPKKPPKKRK
jgi:hypothetical protein